MLILGHRLIPQWKNLQSHCLFHRFHLTKEFIAEDENSLVLDVLSNDVDVDQGDTINITSVGEVLDSEGNVFCVATIVQVDGRSQISITPNENAQLLTDGDIKQ
jgi:hypothetical protein